jgi:hypothetical protein
MIQSSELILIQTEAFITLKPENIAHGYHLCRWSKSCRKNPILWQCRIFSKESSKRKLECSKEKNHSNVNQNGPEHCIDYEWTHWLISTSANQKKVNKPKYHPLELQVRYAIFLLIVLCQIWTRTWQHASFVLNWRSFKWEIEDAFVNHTN